MSNMKVQRSVVVTESQRGCGAVIWWTLSGDLDRDKLTTAWEAEGLAEDWLPKEVTPRVALTAAMHEVKKGQRQLVRSLATGGRAIVSEHADGDDLSYDVPIRAWIDVVGRCKVEPAGHPAAQRIRDAYEHALSVLESAAISDWLCDVARHVNGVPLRTSGGIYFVPPSAIPTWEKVVRAVKAASAHEVVAIPAMRTAEAVATFVAAITADAEAEAAAMAAEVASGELGTRALERRTEKALAVQRRVEQYEADLGVKLSGLTAKLDELRGAVSVALLTASAEEAAAQ